MGMKRAFLSKLLFLFFSVGIKSLVLLSVD